MKHIITFILLTLATPAFAKRPPPSDVLPVEHNGIRYVAPNRNGRVAYLEAWDIKTGKQLWETVVFRNIIKPWLEEDVQCVYIKKLEVLQNILIVTDERGRSYSVDLKTGHVQRTINFEILVVAVLVGVFAVGIQLIKKRARSDHVLKAKRNDKSSPHAWVKPCRKRVKAFVSRATPARDRG